MKRSAGFTLVELIVVFTVSTIIGGVSLAAFSTYSKQQEVNQAALNVKQVIERSRFNAVSSVKPQETYNTCATPPCLKCQVIKGYIVDFSASPPTTQPDCVLAPGQSIAAQPMTIGSDFGITYVGCDKFEFATLTDAAKCLNITQSLPVDITISKNSIPRTITVSSDGSISIK